ncbi:hypothetical protein D3C81_1601640 [compost metagenome]
MLPLVVGAPEHQRILGPHQAAGNLERGLLEGTAKIQPLGVGMRDVDRRAGLHHGEGAGEGLAQEGAEGFVLHVVVLDLAGEL